MIKENAKDFLLPTEKTMGHTPHGLCRCTIIDKMRAKKENSCQKLTKKLRESKSAFLQKTKVQHEQLALIQTVMMAPWDSQTMSDEHGRITQIRVKTAQITKTIITH